MRIGIDARFLTHPQRGGFKTYTENLIAALATVDDTNEYILYIDRSPENYTLPNPANFRYKVISNQMAIFGMPFREQISLPYHASHDNLDLLHSLCLTAPLRLNCPSVVTIHDVIWLFRYHRKPSSLHRYLINRYFRLISPIAAKNASAIITVSEFSKESIHDFLKINPDRIFVTYEAVNSNFRKIVDIQMIDQIRRKHGLTSDYILAIGSSDPRKNIMTLIKAYESLPGILLEKYQLAIIGTDQGVKQLLSQQAYGQEKVRRFSILDQVSNGDLLCLYNGASLFVFPSFNEGFGLPLLEAMACGTPCVAANNSSIPEVVGDAAILVNPANMRGLSEIIAKVLSDDNLKNELSLKGLRRAKYFSWERCAKETISVYEQVSQKTSI